MRRLRSCPIRAIQLQKVQIRQLYLDTQVITLKILIMYQTGARSIKYFVIDMIIKITTIKCFIINNIIVLQSIYLST